MIGIGIVGSGGIALANHIPGFALCPDTKVVALCDADPTHLFNQMTAASNSVRSLYTPVRAVAAAARARLVTAAAQAWSLPAGSLTTKDTG